MVGQGGRPPSYGADGVSHRLLIKQDPTISSGHSGHMSYGDGAARHAASTGSTSVPGRPEGGEAMGMRALFRLLEARFGR